MPYNTLHLSTLQIIHMKHKILLAVLSGAICLGSLTASAQVYPNMHVSYSPGMQKDGGMMAAGRGNPDNALGMPQNSDASTTDAASNYASLGFGGNIVLKFPSKITRGAGPDVTIFETSFGSPSCAAYPEMAKVYFSQNGVNWVSAGQGCQNFDVELPLSLAWAQYIKIVDVSTPASFGSGDADGYDVDGVAAYTVFRPNGTDPVCGNVTVIEYVMGHTKGGNAIPMVRQHSENANVAQMNDHAGPINFVSLGFGSVDADAYLTYELDYTLFDAAGSDIAIYETSWGDNAARSDAAYPEKVEMYGSNDNVTWHLLANVGENAMTPASYIVRDGLCDISTMPEENEAVSIRYLRLVDRSTKASHNFPSSADGFDVDGIVVNCPGTTGGNRTGLTDAGTTDGEVSEISSDMNVLVFPNPVKMGSTLAVSFSASVAGTRNIDLYDVTGKKVQNLFSGNVAEGDQTINCTLGTSAKLQVGFYFVRISGDANTSTGSRIVVTE